MYCFSSYLLYKNIFLQTIITYILFELSTIHTDTALLFSSLLFFFRGGIPPSQVIVQDAPYGCEVTQTTGCSWLTTNRFPIDKFATYNIRGIPLQSQSLFPSAFSLLFFVSLPLLISLSCSYVHSVASILCSCCYLFLYSSRTLRITFFCPFLSNLLLGYTKWLGDGEDPGTYYATVYVYHKETKYKREVKKERKRYVLQQETGDKKTKNEKNRDENQQIDYKYRHDSAGVNILTNGAYFWYFESAVKPKPDVWITHKASFGPRAQHQHHPSAKYLPSPPPSPLLSLVFRSRHSLHLLFHCALSFLTPASTSVLE